MTSMWLLLLRHSEHFNLDAVKALGEGGNEGKWLEG